MFYVYVLENPQGRFYVGQTGNISKRLNDHNRTDCFEGHYTRKDGPWRLVWSEKHTIRAASAVQRERQIKRMKSATWIRTHLLAAHPTAVNPDESGL
jgi:predicted GIY-YIG superfamily endonuclease